MSTPTCCPRPTERRPNGSPSCSALPYRLLTEHPDASAPSPRSTLKSPDIGPLSTRSPASVRPLARARPERLPARRWDDPNLESGALGIRRAFAPLDGEILESAPKSAADDAGVPYFVCFPCNTACCNRLRRRGAQQERLDAGQRFAFHPTRGRLRWRGRSGRQSRPCAPLLPPRAGSPRGRAPFPSVYAVSASSSWVDHPTRLVSLGSSLRATCIAAAAKTFVGAAKTAFMLSLTMSMLRSTDS